MKGISSFYLVIIFLLTILLIYFVCRKKYHTIKFHEFDYKETLFLRGLMAIFIIFCHVSFQYPNSHYFYLFTSFGAPIVSIFLFLSGYGLTVSYQNKGIRYLDNFILKSLSKLLPTFLIFSFIWIIVSYLFFNNNIFQNLLGFIDFNPPLPYSWFIYALFISYIEFYFVYKWPYLADKHDLTKISLLLILNFIFVATLRYLNFEVYWYISLFAFNVGNIYATYHKKVNLYIRKKPILILLLLILTFLACIVLNLRTFTLSIIPLGVVIPIVLIGGFTKSKILNRLGKLSYEIYLAHGLVVPTLSHFSLYWPINLFFSIILSILLAYLINKFYKIDYISKKLYKISI